MPEEWGGDAIICPVSALTGRGVDHLLEMILLVAEVRSSRPTPTGRRGPSSKAKLDKGMGPVATVIVQDERCVWAILSSPARSEQGKSDVR